MYASSLYVLKSSGCARTSMLQVHPIPVRTQPINASIKFEHVLALLHHSPPLERDLSSNPCYILHQTPSSWQNSPSNATLKLEIFHASRTSTSNIYDAWNSLQLETHLSSRHVTIQYSSICWRSWLAGN